MRIKNINIEDVDPIIQLLQYITPRKSIAKVTKDLDSLKYNVFTPLLQEEVPIQGNIFPWVQFLNIED